MDKKSKPTDLGMNRTGIAMAPMRAKEMVDGVKQFMPTLPPDGQRIEEVRLEMSRNAPPVGLMPPPSTIKGAVKSAVKAIQGESATVFLDKLGERAAFERTGVRLYQALIVKFEASSGHEGGPTRDELERICDDELKHFAMVGRAIEKMGADPTVMTPCADVMAVASSGFAQVLNDPRVTLTQGLEAILAVELTDNDSWRMLMALAQKLGQDEIANDFATALAEEDEHLMLVRRWLANAVFGQAGVEVPAELHV
jgi:rubrerythrin